MGQGPEFLELSLETFRNQPSTITEKLQQKLLIVR